MRQSWFIALGLKHSANEPFCVALRGFYEGFMLVKVLLRKVFLVGST